MSNGITIGEEDPYTPDAMHLMDELSDALESITGNSGRSSFNLNDVCGQQATFVIARNDDGEAVGCGAIRPIDNTMAEVKRMYAKEKGMGVGAKVLSYLEIKALEMGYSVLRLETRSVNHRAVEFYENRGYYQIPNYGKYVNRPEAVCFEKQLIKRKD
jgi:ribosomal protein S18 acetylase RimI-like enzyme